MLAARMARFRVVGADTTLSVPHSAHGSMATDHDRFGALPVETIGPHTANAIAPIVEAAAEKRLEKNSHAPTAASGNGQRHPQVETEHLAANQPRQNGRRQEHLIQRVGVCSLTGAHVRIPQRPLAREPCPAEPQIASPEILAEVSNVEDAGARKSR